MNDGVLPRANHPTNFCQPAILDFTLLAEIQTLQLHHLVNVLSSL